MYIKLVLRNVRRSVRDYLIYIVTMTICAALFYAFLSVSSQYYRPDIGAEYDFGILGMGMKASVAGITLLLLFLIHYVNGYMLRCRQKELALLLLTGLEQKTAAWLFFGETLVIGMISVVPGIFGGLFCSQFITGILLSFYGKSYELTWTLFPDTAFFTVAFFLLSLFLVGLFNVRSVRKTKLIHLLYGERYNELSVKKSRLIRGVTGFYTAALLWMLFDGSMKIYYYFDPRYPVSVYIGFWSGALLPGAMLLWSGTWLAFRKSFGFEGLLKGLMPGAFFCFFQQMSMPWLQQRYHLAFGNEGVLQYFFFGIIGMIFLICAFFYMISGALKEWKERSVKRKYKGENLFLFGQIVSRLETASKAMSLICITLVLAVFLLLSELVLSGWALGFLEQRSMYDVQISSYYNTAYTEAELPGETDYDDYRLVEDFLREQGISVSKDRSVDTYLLEKSEFTNRLVMDFPVTAISLSDYNALREMLGYEKISLREGEFTTQWQSIATEAEREEHLKKTGTIKTDGGSLVLAPKAYYTESIGETIYNLYTDVLYILPDRVCEKLLNVERYRFIMTEEDIPYETAKKLEALFLEEYPDMEAEGTGMYYYLQTRTRQVSDTKGNIFVMKTAMLYGAVVLMVICLTILSLQQLMDAAHHRYRFGVLRRMGAEEKNIRRLALKQLGIWFGLPVAAALVISAVLICFFVKMCWAEIQAYIGVSLIAGQGAAAAGILFSLLFCYFASTWLLFLRNIGEETSAETQGKIP